jgi:CarD family transcriptional regulator
MFNVGDVAVYPAHGVGTVEAIETKKIGDNELSFYVIRIHDSDMVVMIPTKTCKNVGLRTIISSTEVEEVYDILKDKEVKILTVPWNQRYREYMEKIKTGSAYEIASVLRDLFVLSVDKDLSFGERKMKDTAQNLLVKEIAIANALNEGQVQDDIQQIFS